MNSAFDVIIAPVVTEKCNALIQENKYTFRVHPDAGRIEIARAVEELFKAPQTPLTPSTHSPTF